MAEKYIPGAEVALPEHFYPKEPPKPPVKPAPIPSVEGEEEPPSYFPESEAKAKDYAARADEQRRLVERYSREMEQWVSRRPEGLPFPANIITGWTRYTIPAVIVGTLKARSLRPMIESAGRELAKYDYLEELYTVAPVLAVSGQVASTQELLERFPPPEPLTPSEEEELRTSLDGVFRYPVPPAPGEPPIPEAIEAIELPELIIPKEPPVGRPVGLHTLSTEEIIKALRVAAVPPAVMTPEQYASLLNDDRWADVDLDAKEAFELEAGLIMEDMKEANEIRQQFLAGLGEMPDYSTWDMVKLAATQPAMAVMDIAKWYFRNVSQATAAEAWQHLPWWELPEMQTRMEELTPTLGRRMAASQAWEEWEGQGWLVKYMIMENLSDPLTWTPLIGLVGKGLMWTGRGLRLTSMTRMGMGIYSAYGAWMAGIDMPFDAFKWLMRRVPKTSMQRAALAQMSASRALKKYFPAYAKKPTVASLTMEDISDGTKAAIKEFKARPGSQSSMADAGAELLKHSPYTKEGVEQYRTALRSTLGKDDVTINTVYAVDEVFEDMFMRGVPREEAAGRLLATLSAPVDDKNIKLAERLLAKRADAIEKGAVSIVNAASPYDALKGVGLRNFKIQQAIEKSASALAATRYGMVRTLLHNTVGKTQVIWRNSIDRYFVKTFAEVYLTFGMYGPMNVLEDLWRSALAGVFPRRASRETWEKIAYGLSVDPNIGGRAISETYGYMPLTREAGEWSNWILQLGPGGGMLRKPGAKVYDVLVRGPGEVGAGIRANFVGQKYISTFKERGGPMVEAMMETVRKPGSDLGDAALRRELRKQTETMATTGESDLVRGVADGFTHKALTKKEVKTVLDQFPDIPPQARQHIMKAYDEGRLLNRIDDVSREVDDMILDDFLRSPEYATRQYEELTKSLTDILSPEPRPRAPLAKGAVREPWEMTRAEFMKDVVEYGVSETPEKVVIQRLGAKGRVAEAVQTLTPEERLRWDELQKLGPAERASAEWSFLDEIGATKKLGGPIGDHGVVVREAVKEGRSVPAEVLAEYPELAKAVREAAGIRTPEDMAWAMVQLGVMSDNYGALPGQVMGAITRKSRGLPVPQRDAAFNDTFARLDRFISDAGLDIDDIITRLKGASRGIGLSDDAITRADRLFDVRMAKRVAASEFKSANMARRSEIFAATPPKERTSAFWDDFAAEMKVDYDEFGLRDAELYGVQSRIEDEINRATGVALTRPPVVVRGRALCNADVGALLGCRTDDISRALTEVMVLNDKAHFTAYVMGKVRAGDIGFTREAVEEVYDSIVRGLHINPKDMSFIQRSRIASEGIRQDLWSIKHSKMYGPDQVAGIKKYVDDAASALDDVMYTTTKPRKPGKLPEKRIKPEFTDLQAFRQSCMDDAHKWYYKEFTDYTNANAFDALMKSIFPYWTYESQRWFWVPRSFIRHPGTFTAFERWQNNTDYGYVHIPGTSIDINPFRGTVYGTMTTRLARRDFPEYYDSLGAAAGAIEAQDYLSRFGFYPGAHFTVPMALFGGEKPQMGETLPAIWKTPLNALIAKYPESESVKWLSEHIFSDRFRDYMTMREVDTRGYDGSLIWSKMKEGKALTPEEQAVWDSSRGEAATYGIAFEQFGLFRFRPDEVHKAYQEASKVIEEITGVTEEQQTWLRRHNINIWDTLGGLDPETQAILEEMGYYRYIGNITPLLPSRQQQELRIIELFWDDVDRFGDTLLDKKQQVANDFRMGRISRADYAENMSAVYKQGREYVDTLKATVAYEDVPITLEERTEFYKEHNKVIPVMHPLKELSALYFSVELVEKIDKETGERVLDWDNFWAQRQAIDDAVATDFRPEWEAYISKNTPPLEKLRFDVNEQYFRVYNNVWEIVMTERFDEEEGKLIREFYSLKRTGKNLSRQQEIQDMLRPDQKKLISSFQTEISKIRVALRYANPTLDSWLYYFGKVTSFKTDSAMAIYIELCKQTGKVYEGDAVVESPVITPAEVA